MVSRQGRDGPKENKTNKNRRRSTRKKIVVSENRALWTSLISDLNYWIGRTVGKKEKDGERSKMRFVFTMYPFEKTRRLGRPKRM